MAKMRIWEIAATVRTIYVSAERPSESDIRDAVAEEARNGAGFDDADVEACPFTRIGSAWGDSIPWRNRDDVDAKALGDKTVDEILVEFGEST